MRAALAARSAGATVTHSELEERFLALLARGHFPRPEVNVHIEGFEVDFSWRSERLVVELDGRASHDTFAAFERDRILQAAGWRVVRITWRQMDRTPRQWRPI